MTNMQKKTNPTLRFLCKWWKVMVIALAIGVVGGLTPARCWKVKRRGKRKRSFEFKPQ